MSAGSLEKKLNVKRKDIPTRQSQRRALLVVTVRQGCAHFSSCRRAVKARIAFCPDAQCA
jgi:hypothetical protein